MSNNYEIQIVEIDMFELATMKPSTMQLIYAKKTPKGKEDQICPV